MSLGAPVNWSSSTASPAAQPQYFRYQGESYVQMGDGKILSHSSYMQRASQQNIQAGIEAARRYDPSEPSRQAARAAEQSAQQYRSPVTGQVVPRDQYFAEHSRIHAQARENYGQVAQQRVAQARTAWDTPLPRGVTLDMIPDGNGSFTAAPPPSGGAIIPSRPINQTPAGANVSSPPFSGPVAAPPALRRGLYGQAATAAASSALEPLKTPMGRAGTVVGGASIGVGAAISSIREGGGFFETGSGFIFGLAGGIAGGVGGAAVGGAVTGAAGVAIGSVAPGVGNAVGGATGLAVGGYVGAGIGTGIGGGIGASAGRGLGRFVDNLIPDVVLPKPPLVPRWAWPFNAPEASDYPNELPPDALGQGPKVDDGAPGNIATGSRAIPYNVQWRNPGTTTNTYFGQTDNGGTPDWQVLGQRTGPISVQDRGENGSWLIHTAGEDSIGGGSYTTTFRAPNPATGLFEDYPVIVTAAPQFAAAAVDGSQDPVVGTVPPTYAPNPARRRPASSPRPRNLPPPVAVPQPGLQPTGATNPNGSPQYGPGPHPWPGSDPAYRPEPPLAPTPAAPPNFQPSNLGDPAPAFDPAKDIAAQPDLDNPSKTAPAIDGNPGTPPMPEPHDYSGGAAPGAAVTILRRDTGWRGRDPNEILRQGGTLESRVQGEDAAQSNQNDLLPAINPPAVQNPTVPLIVPLTGFQPAITPRNPTQPFPPPATTPQTPTTPNPNIDPTPPARPPNTPNPNPRALCQYERSRVMDIQNKSTNTNQRASNPTSGFPGLYGLQIESRVKQGQIFDLVTSTKAFMQKAWEMTRIQKVLDVLTFIGVMHNVSMLSRDVGETFFQLIGQGIQAAGVRDEEGGIIDVPEVVGDATESFLRRVLGSDVYDGINEARNKANRIISSASAVIWTVRSIADSSLDLMEWIGENTGRIGNALKRWGVVGERSYPWMSENAKAQSRFRNRFSKVTDALENTEDRLSVYMQATSTVIDIQDEFEQGQENWRSFKASVEDGIPDPWLDNNPIKDGYDASKAISDGPDVQPSEAQKG